MLSNFSGKGLIPSPEIKCPKYCIWLLKKLHFSQLSFRSASLNLWNSCLMCTKCVGTSGLYINISSRYPNAKCNPTNTLLISL